MKGYFIFLFQWIVFRLFVFKCIIPFIHPLKYLLSFWAMILELTKLKCWNPSWCLLALQSCHWDLALIFLRCLYTVMIFVYPLRIQCLKYKVLQLYSLFHIISWLGLFMSSSFEIVYNITINRLIYDKIMPICLLVAYRYHSKIKIHCYSYIWVCPLFEYVHYNTYFLKFRKCCFSTLHQFHL